MDKDVLIAIIATVQVVALAFIGMYTRQTKSDMRSVVKNTNHLTEIAVAQAGASGIIEGKQIERDAADVRLRDSEPTRVTVVADKPVPVEVVKP